MSIDLSKVTAISDQYGPYAQIADASGNVLWSAVQNLTVTMTQANPSNVDAYLQHKLGGSNTYISEPGTYKLPAGTNMVAVLYSNQREYNAYVYWNGVQVATGQLESTGYAVYYRFTLTTNITFYYGLYGKGYPSIFINEV